MSRVPRRRKLVHNASSRRSAKPKKLLFERRRRPAAKIVLTARQYGALSRSERVAYRQALDALSLIRHDKLSLTKAARQAGTTPAAVLKYAGMALRRNRQGRTMAKPTDRLYRRMRVPTPEGVKEVGIRGSRVASRLSKFWQVVHVLRDTGEGENRLREFTDFFPGGEQVETDPASLEAMARRGELDFEEIYNLTA